MNTVIRTSINSARQRRSGWKSRRLYLAVAVAATVAIVGSACSSPGGSPGTETPASGDATASEELVLAAQAEGSVVWLGSFSEAVLQMVAEGFEEKYGIRVDYQRLATGAQAKVVDQQFDSGQVQFDVSLMNDEYWTSRHAEEGRWLELDPAELPNLERLSEDLRKDFWIPAGTTLFGVVYNSDNVTAAEVPEDYGDFLAPRWKNRLGILDIPHVGRSALGSLLALSDHYGDGFEEYLGQLFDQNPTIFSSAAEGTQLVVAGEIDAFILAGPTFYFPLRDKGAPVGITFPTPTATYSRTAQAAADAPHPNAAKLLIDYLISPEGQEMVNGHEQGTSPYEGGAKTGFELPAGVVTPDPTAVAEAAESLIKMWEAAQR